MAFYPNYYIGNQRKCQDFSGKITHLLAEKILIFLLALSYTKNPAISCRIFMLVIFFKQLDAISSVDFGKLNLYDFVP